MRARAIVAGLVLAAGLAAACGHAKSPVMASLKVRKGNFQIVLPAFGELQAAKSTPLSIPPENRFGRQTISWMAPEYSAVKQGDIVIRMASTELTELLQTEEAAMAKLNLEINQKEKQLEKERTDLAGEITVTSIQRELADVYAARDETIFSRNKILEDAIDLNYQTVREAHYGRKKDQLEKKVAAELQLLQSKARTCRVKMDQYREQLNNLEIRAPHDGILIIDTLWNGEKFRVGMNVWAGQKLGSLPDLNVMEAKLFILESEASGLKESLPVSLSLDFEPGRVFSGKVVGLDTIAKPLGEESPLKYFETKVSLDATDPALMKPGVQVKASVFVEKLADVITVPNQALSYENGQAFILVKNSSRVQKRPVEVGPRSLTQTVITKGIKEGDGIVLGQPQPKAGEKSS